MNLTDESIFFVFFLTQVYLWVLNDEEDFKRAFDLGATGVMTDYPTKLKEFMECNIPFTSKWPVKAERLTVFIFYSIFPPFCVAWSEYPAVLFSHNSLCMCEVREEADRSVLTTF